jgi:large subunit ribosomal protein LP2
LDVDDERIKKLRTFPLISDPTIATWRRVVSELKGKDINELIAEGSSKLASVPSGGAAAGGAGAAGGAPGGAQAAAEEEKKEEEEEEKEESDEDMGFGLFD